MSDTHTELRLRPACQYHSSCSHLFPDYCLRPEERWPLLLQRYYSWLLVLQVTALLSSRGVPHRRGKKSFLLQNFSVSLCWGLLSACLKLYLSFIRTHWLSFLLFNNVFQLQRLYNNIYEIMSSAHEGIKINFRKVARSAKAFESG